MSNWLSWKPFVTVITHLQILQHKIILHLGLQVFTFKIVFRKVLYNNKMPRLFPPFWNSHNNHRFTHCQGIRSLWSVVGAFYSSYRVKRRTTVQRDRPCRTHGCVNIRAFTYSPGLSIPSYPSHSVVQLPPSSVCYLRPPSNHIRQPWVPGRYFTLISFR